MWQLSFPLCESEAKRLSSDLALLKAHLMDRCGDWHDPVPSMIQNTDLTMMMGIPAYDRVAKLPATTSMRNIILLGYFMTKC
jgi:salicylate hydroxylase